MSVVAAAAVGPTPVAPAAAVVVPYGLYGGGGARKRKDVVHYQEEEDAGEEEDHRRQGGEDDGGAAHGLFVLETVEEVEEDREVEAEAEKERSSIGAVSEGEEEEGEVAESKATPPPWQRRKKKDGGLTCLDALDDALPIKRGLSSYFSGKSRSFANLQDVAGSSSSSKDVLAKPENPFNKRRRILQCCSIRRVSSTSLTALPPFQPPEPSFNIGNDGVINGGTGSG